MRMRTDDIGSSILPVDGNEPPELALQRHFITCWTTLRYEPDPFRRSLETSSPEVGEPIEG